MLGALTFWSLLVCIALAAGCYAVLSAVGFRFVNELAPEGQRTRLVGQLNAAQSVGGIVGQSVGGVLVGLIAPPLVTLLDSVMSLLGVAMLSRAPERQDGDNAPVSDGGVDNAPAPKLRQIWGAAFRKQSLQLAITVGSAGSIVEPVVVLFLLRVAHLDALLVGVALGLGAVGGVLGGLLVGVLAERWSTPAIVLLGILFMGVGTAALLVLGGASGKEFVGAVVFELGTAFGGVLIVASAMGELQEQTSRDRIGRTVTAAAVTLEGTGIVVIGVGSLLASVTDLRVPFFVAMARYVVAAILALRMRSREPAHLKE